MAINCPVIVLKRGTFPASENDITIFEGGKSCEPNDTQDQASLYFVTKGVQSKEIVDDTGGINNGGYADEPVLDTRVSQKNCMSFQPGPRTMRRPSTAGPRAEIFLRVFFVMTMEKGGGWSCIVMS